MEAIALDQQDIGQGHRGVRQKKDIEHLLSAAPIDDLPEHIKIKCEFNHGRDVAEQRVVDHGSGEVVLDPCKNAAEQQEEGEIPKPPLWSGKEKYRQTG